jgi:hypothetical protein
MSNTKLTKNELFEKLSDDNELSIETLESIYKNYNIIKNLIQSIDSKEEFLNYVKYVKIKDELSEERAIIDKLTEICDDYNAKDWMEPMLAKLESVSFDKKESGCWKNYTEIRFNFNEFSIKLNYHCDDHNCRFYLEKLSINECESFEKYREGIKEIMNYFGLPKEKIVDFNDIMLEWLFQNDGFCSNLGTSFAKKYFKAFD